MQIPGKIRLGLLTLLGALSAVCSQALAGVRIEGQVQAGGGPISNSTVTLWSASAGEPKQLAEAKTGSDGQFQLGTDATPGTDTILYLVAKGGVATINKGSGDNPAIVLLTVLGNRPPAKVVINEMTTVASVWTHAQFLDGTAITGHPLGLRIAAGNVPNFVDLATGGWGEAIQGPLNSGQTPTMANFATLADVISGCVVQVQAAACNSLFAASTSPTGTVPTDTLAAAESVARYPWYQPNRLYDLLGQFYQVSTVNHMLTVPYMPYLNWAPSAWVLPLKFDGGGYRAAWQGHVRQRGQPLGWRQLYHWLAGAGLAVAGSCDQVRTQW